MSRLASPRTRYPETPSGRLSAARQRLVALLRHVHFGRVLDLHVLGGQPLFDPPPRVVRTVKLTGTIAPRSSEGAGGAALPRECADLMAVLDDVRDGVIGRIEVAHGAPLFAEVHETAPAA